MFPTSLRCSLTIGVLWTVLPGLSFAQESRKSLTLTPSAEFRLSPEVDGHAVRDIEWFAKLPTNASVFIRRELPVGTYTIVKMNAKCEILTEATIELPWKEPLTGLQWSCPSQTRSLVLEESSGIHRSHYAIFDTETGATTQVGTFRDLHITSVCPVWNRGFVALGLDVKLSNLHTTLIRFDLKMQEVWRVDNPGVEGESLTSFAKIRSTGKEFVGALTSDGSRVVRFAIEDGARSEIPLPELDGAAELVNGYQDSVGVLMTEKGDQILTVLDTNGALSYRRQVTAAFSTRIPIRSDQVFISSAGNIWFTDGHAIFEILKSGHAHKVVGMDTEAPLVRELGATIVNLEGHILCQDIPSGALFDFDRGGKFVRTEPTSSADFPRVGKPVLGTGIAVTKNGDLMLQPYNNYKRCVVFSPDLVVKGRKDLNPGFWSVNPTTSARCEWLKGVDVTVYDVNGEAITMPLSGEQGDQVTDARVLDDNSLAVLLTSRGNPGMTLVRQSRDGTDWFRTEIKGPSWVANIEAGRRWLCAYNPIGQGLLLDTFTNETFDFDLRDDKATTGRLRYFIDTSQATGEELVEIDCLTRVVRRFPLPTLSKPAETRPIVK